MTELICPIMSKPSPDIIIDPDGMIRYYGGELMKVICQREQCMAWVEHIPVDDTDHFVGGYCALINKTLI